MSLPALKQPKTSTIANGRKVIESQYVDGSEMIEEYDTVTDELLLRKVRRPTALGVPGEWAVEVGSERRIQNVDRDLMVEHNTAPQLVRQDTVEKYVWRIRNLPYSKETYQITIEAKAPSTVAVGSSAALAAERVGSIVVRTSNKKFFKVIDIPDMTRAGVALDATNLSWNYSMNTLLIEYKKHLSIRTVEAVEKKERSAMPSKRLTKEEGCSQQ